MTDRESLRARIRSASGKPDTELLALLDRLATWWTAHPDDIELAIEASSVARILDIREHQRILDLARHQDRPDRLVDVERRVLPEASGLERMLAPIDRTVADNDHASAAGAPSDEITVGSLKPRADGMVYCCATLGWVDPETAFDHRWDTSRSPDEYESERASSWDGVKPGL